MSRVRGSTAAFALLALLLPACHEAPAADAPLLFPRAPVLLISIDTLRADRLGCYGYARGTSPRLDAFADESVLFEDVWSTSCKTAESHMSLFTSLPVSAHGVSNSSARLKLPVHIVGKNRLTLPQVLNRAGYWNAGVACGGNLIGGMGFDRGFEKRFTSEIEDISVIVERTLAAVDAGLAQPDPMFLFMHTYQVHGPYLPPAAFRERFAPEPRGLVGQRVLAIQDLPFQQQWGAMFSSFWADVERFGPEDSAYLSDLYDGEIAYTDEQVGLLFDALEERGVFDRMIVIVLSDHGEEFAEHGHYEHDQLYPEELHVPLLVRLPGGRLGGTRVSGKASLLDVMPTLLELVGLAGPGTMTGQSLVPAMGSGRTPDQPVLSERIMFPEAYMASLRTQGTATVFRAESQALEQYDRSGDPGETRDLGAAAPFAQQAGGALHRMLAGLFTLREQLDADGSGGTFVIDEAARQELLQLNYTGEGEPAPAPAGSPLERWPADGPR
jgi:hypothetical protein